MIPAEPAAVVSVAAPRPGSARVPAEDPQADRGVVLPTAYTHPKGPFFVSDYDVALVQIGYAFTDDTQISLTGVPPLEPEAHDAGSLRTAQAAAKFIAEARRLLASEKKANGVTLRGFSTKPALPSYEEVYGLRAAAIAGAKPASEAELMSVPCAYSIEPPAAFAGGSQAVVEAFEVGGNRDDLQVSQT